MTEIIVVFGGSGDIGKVICQELVKTNYKIMASFCNNKETYDTDIDFFYYNVYSGMNEDIFQKIYNCKVKAIIFSIGANSSKNKIDKTDIEEFKRLYMINCVSLIDIYKKLNDIILRDKTNIYILSSCASYENKAGNGPYSASKAYLNSISDTIKNELKEKQIDVKKLILPRVYSKMMISIAKGKGYKTIDEYIAKELNGKILFKEEIAKSILCDISGSCYQRSEFSWE